ncbi:MAG: U32 family peptidase, partial [Clostridia bacterium]|nr:U32 family peptidase [Clostridia bacterium]
MTLQTEKRSELLCPAGSPLALAAAIEGGADAIYVGGTAFNARIHAKNFTPEELREGISLAHAYGAKVYITANTLIYDRELDAMLRAAEDAYLAGADALIVADLGAARQIRSRIPIPLHASTQVSGHNVDAARILAEAGFCRMVCAREMSREDLRYFTEHSPIEAEVFVHGALCVCHSGQCLFSSLVGGRSGNRGECAQPCRLPFQNGKRVSYPLSLKDLSLARHVPELMEMGVASFKIEGRMKSPEYVREVARIFRRLIDERRGANDEDMAELAAVFSRNGLTDGYYEKKITSAMLGRRTEEDKQSSRALEPFHKITRKVPVHLSVSIKAGEAATFTAWDDRGGMARLTGEVPQQAKNAPLTEESVRKSFTKLGNTPYESVDIQVTLDEGLMLPVSAMNNLRRETILALQKGGDETAARREADFMPLLPMSARRKRGRGASAVFYRPEEIPKEVLSRFEVTYVPVDRYDGMTNGVLLPPVIFDGEREKMETLLRRAKSLGAEHALIGNLGHLNMVKEAGLIPHGDFRLNITNGETAAELERLGLEDVILSPELTLPQLRDVGGATKVVVYGRIPLMVTEKCVGKELGGCETCQSGKAKLTDRRGVSFPVLKEWQHRSLILNSVPLYMADREEDL